MEYSLPATAMSCSWRPFSTIRPSEKTQIWSASRTVDSRWAMMIVVRGFDFISLES